LTGLGRPGPWYGRLRMMMEDPMKLTRHALAVLAVLAFALAAVPAVQAHGGHDHVMGKVKAVDPQAGTVQVEGHYHKLVTVVVNDQTKFMRGDTEAAAAEMVVGSRVVIDVDTVDGKKVAKQIRLGTDPPPPSKP